MCVRHDILSSLQPNEDDLLDMAESFPCTCLDEEIEEYLDSYEPDYP